MVSWCIIRHAKINEVGNICKVKIEHGIRTSVKIQGKNVPLSEWNYENKSEFEYFVTNICYK